MNDARDWNADPGRAEAFERAIDLFREERFEQALPEFVRLAESEQWFDRCSAYILAICSELLRKGVGSSEQLRKIEANVIARMLNREARTKGAAVVPRPPEETLIFEHLPGLPFPGTFRSLSSDRPSGDRTKR